MRRSPREIERELERISPNDNGAGTGGSTVAYEHPETGELLDGNGEPFEASSGPVIALPHSVWGTWRESLRPSIDVSPTDDPVNHGEDTDSDIDTDQ